MQTAWQTVGIFRCDGARARTSVGRSRFPVVRLHRLVPHHFLAMGHFWIAWDATLGRFRVTPARTALCREMETTNKGWRSYRGPGNPPPFNHASPAAQKR